MSSFLLLIVASLRLHLISPAATRQAMESLTITSAQGSGDCVSVDGQQLALNCSLPFLLTLTVDGLRDLPAPAYSFYLIIDDDSWTAWYDPEAGNVTATSIAIPITAPSFQLDTGRLLNVTLWDVRDYSAVVYSPPTPAFSLAYTPPLQVTAVSGCQPTANPLFTADCMPEVDVLTLTGTGFSSLTSLQCMLSQPGYSSGSRSISVSTRWGPLVLLNDSVMLLPLLDLRFLNQAAHYDGRVLSMALVIGRYYTNQWNVTMAYLPPADIMSYTVQGVQSVLVANVTTFPQCVPAVSAIVLKGHFLFWTAITVGGAQCLSSGYFNSPTLVGCRLPIVEPDVGDVLYDLVLNSTQGALLTLPGIIGYTALPTIASVSACWSTDGYTSTSVPSLHCLAGDSITVYGRRFLAAGFALNNVTIDSGLASGSAPPASCRNLTVVSDSAVTCMLPPPTSPTDGVQYWVVQATWNGNYTTNQLIVDLYDSWDVPRILAVSGCGQGSNLSTGLGLSGCQLGALITLSGFNLAASSSVFDVVSVISASTGYYSFYCAPLTLVSNATATCQLPTASQFGWAVWYAQYNLTMREQDSWTPVTSNYFSISFAPPCNVSCPASSSSSSSSSSTTFFSSSSSPSASSLSSSSSPSASSLSSSSPPSSASALTSSSASSRASTSSPFSSSSSSSTASPSFTSQSSAAFMFSSVVPSSSAAGGEGGGSSSSSVTVAAVASVLSAVALLLLLGAGCWLWRRRVQRRGGKRGSAGWSSGDSSEAMTGGGSWQSFNSANDSTAEIELTDG